MVTVGLKGLNLFLQISFHFEFLLTLACLCCVCISELQDIEPSAGPAAVHQLPATKGQVLQTAADIHSQLEVRSAFSAVSN